MKVQRPGQGKLAGGIARELKLAILDGCEDWDMDEDDILDLDAEGEDDTFLGTNGDLESTRNLAAQARRDTGMMQRSPSPAGSASSLEGVDMEPRRISKKRKISKEKGIASQTIAKITLNAVKETMRMCA